MRKVCEWNQNFEFEREKEKWTESAASGKKRVGGETSGGRSEMKTASSNLSNQKTIEKWKKNKEKHLIKTNESNVFEKNKFKKKEEEREKRFCRQRNKKEKEFGCDFLWRKQQRAVGKRTSKMTKTNKQVIERLKWWQTVDVSKD